ncbi:TOBE domain-containing protein [Lyngbya aestuarii]|uniref:TOBE domain-containing protein n=1 Tax=Lyngbya aestuarii TaxID=118322 RepID=UPI00403E2077
MKVSARNNIKGTVKKVIAGAVNSEIIIEIAPGIEMTGIITNSSSERLNIKEGSEAYAVVKASDVIIAVD